MRWDIGTGQEGHVTRLRNLATGKERDLYRGPGNCIFASRHPSLFCSEEAPDGSTTNIFSIAVGSGRIEQLGAVRGKRSLQMALPDDQAVYFRREETSELMRWDIGTGQEILVERPAGSSLNGSVIPSPDGGWLKRFLKGNIEIRPMAGGDWKPLIPLRGDGQSGFSPDGKWIFYHDKDPAGKDGLYRAATGGGAPERLGDFPTDDVRGVVRISPDGRRIIALTSVDIAKIADLAKIAPPEAWLLENFEPKQQAAK